MMLVEFLDTNLVDWDGVLDDYKKNHKEDK